MFGLGYSLDQDFVSLYNKIPSELKIIDGILDIDPFINSKRYHTTDIVNNSVDANANVRGRSIQHYESERYKSLGKLNSYYLLYKYMKQRYGKEDADKAFLSNVNGNIYIHDLGLKFEMPYCFSMDTNNIMYEGRPFGNIQASPPKRMDSFIGQMETILRYMCLEFAGAIGLGNFLINLAYFTKNHTDKEIENRIQSLVHTVNEAIRPSGDSMFSNVSVFDEHIIRKTFAEHTYPDGTKAINNITEIMRVQKIMCEFMAKGNPITGKPYTFPIMCSNHYVVDHKIQDNEFFEYICDLNRDKCIFNIHQGTRLNMCCRYSADLASLKDTVRSDTFGNGGVSIGSGRIITLNLNRIALNAKKNHQKQTFFDSMTEYLSVIEKVLITHRNDVLKRRIDEGILTFFRIKWIRPEIFFSTIGYCGLYDAYMTLYEHFDKEGYIAFAKKVLSYMDTFAKEAGIRNSCAFNVEESPVEVAGAKLALKDRYFFSECTNEVLSNQMLPLYEQFELQDRLDVCKELSNLVSGGSILHINLDASMNLQANRDFTRKLIEEYNIPHFSFDVGFSTCEDGHVTKGMWELCPTCDKSIMSFLKRVVGFMTESMDWIEPRQNELMMRQRYKIE